MTDKNKLSSDLIMIVEDDFYCVEYYKCIFDILKIESIAACDGKHALQHVAENGNKISIIFTDKNLPDMSGVELAQNIRSHYGTNWRPSIILSSGDHDPLPAGERKLFDYIIYKPFRFKDITECLYKIKEPPSI